MSQRLLVGSPIDHIPTVAELEALTDITHTVKRPVHRVLDLFAGTGIGVAVEELGAVSYPVDIMPEVDETRALNGMSRIIYTDVWDAQRAEGLHFDTIAAGPPCPSFSSAGNGSGRRQMPLILQAIEEGIYKDIDALHRWADTLEDERTGLVLTPLHYIYRFRPTYILLEQVKEVMPVWSAYAEVLREWGYSVWTDKMFAEQYGVPQTRIRAILMARRDGKVAKQPTPTHSRYYSRSPEKLDPGVKKWVSMAEALGRLAERPAPTVTGGGAMTGGWEPFGPGGRRAVRASLSSATMERDRTLRSEVSE